MDAARAALLASIAYYADPSHYEPGDRAYWHEDAEKMLDALIAAVRAESGEFHHRLPGQAVCNICAEYEAKLAALREAADELLRSFVDTDDGQIVCNVDRDGIFNFPDDVRVLRAVLAATPAEHTHSAKGPTSCYICRSMDRPR